jgi:hypothetical protein
MRAAWRPPHLLLGVHSTVQQPLHRAFRDRRRDWLLAAWPSKALSTEACFIAPLIGIALIWSSLQG